ncbi:MAG: hypothetical protein ABEI52_06935 [Halobacteriaceae archaeon]
MASEETTHVRVYKSDKDRIRATTGKGNMAHKLSKIVDDYWHHAGPHHPVLQEREDKPLGPYVQCRDCGRSENTLQELNDRPCEEQIAVNE